MPISRKKNPSPFPALARCQTCGADGQEKNVYKPFAHGWVGCRNCKRYIHWVKGGKRTAIELWNAQNGGDTDAHIKED